MDCNNTRSVLLILLQIFCGMRKKKISPFSALTLSWQEALKNSRFNFTFGGPGLTWIYLWKNRLVRQKTKSYCCCITG